MLNRAYTEACQKSEKELKKLYVIERECTHKIDFQVDKFDLDLILSSDELSLVLMKYMCFVKHYFILNYTKNDNAITIHCKSTY